MNKNTARVAATVHTVKTGSTNVIARRVTTFTVNGREVLTVLGAANAVDFETARRRRCR